MGKNIGKKVAFFLILGIYVAYPLYAKEIFYASFDKGLDADNALGKKEAKIVGAAKITAGNKGYSSKSEGQGEALDAGYSTNETAVVAYSTKGNINPLQGTIEMLVKTNYNWDFKESYWQGKYQSRFFRAPFVNDGFIDILCYHYAYSYPNIGQVYVGYMLHDGVETYQHTFNVWANGMWRAGDNWTKDNWHHIAVTWTSTETKLYVDKKLKEDKKWDKPINLMPFKDEFYIGGLADEKSCRALIDEVRISDEPLSITEPEEKK